jgi:hypothetical protein
MLFELNYRVIEKVNADLVNPIREACKNVNWNNGTYNRLEKVLSDGKLIEFPFLIRTTIKDYTLEQAEILKASKPLLDWILTLPRFVGYKWIRGEVATLLPGVTLGWHKDPHWFQDNCIRLHVPIYTNDQCVQLWKNEECHMEIDHLYELNNRVIHSATNKGTDFRTHLVLDTMPESKWQESRQLGINPIGFVDPLNKNSNPT